VFDFYRSLRQEATRLRVLGNGRQRKSYLYIDDCLDAMLLAMEQTRGRLESSSRYDGVRPGERPDRLDLRTPRRPAGA